MIGDIKIGAVCSPVYLNHSNTLFRLKHMIIGRDHENRYAKGMGAGDNFFFDRTSVPVDYNFHSLGLFHCHHQVPV
ncbi:hypothetical protein D3C75_1093530 [compost metagenome]